MADASVSSSVGVTSRTAPSAGAPTGRGSGHKLRTRLVEVAFVVPAVVYLVLFFGYPVVKNVFMGFQAYTTKTFYTGEAPWVGLANYSAVVGNAIFDRTLWNTLFFTAGSIVGQFALGLAIALFFHKRFALSGVLRSLILLPWLIPMIAGTAVWRWILDTDNGALNRILSAVPGLDLHPNWLTSPQLALVAVIGVNIWLGIPFNMTILYGGLQEIPEELYEAGALDGATGWRAFRHITWPMLRPVVTVVLVLGVVYTLKVLDVILGLTNGGPANSTQTISTFSYDMSFRQFDFGQGAALGNILILISLVFAVVYLRINRKAVDE
jgi:multiple sugar transport system permease protein